MFPRASDTRVDGPCQGSEQVCFLVLVTCILNSRFEVPVVLQSFGLSPCRSRNCSRCAFAFVYFPSFHQAERLRLPVIVWPSSTSFLNPDRAEKYRRCFFQHAIMPRCQRGHSRHSKGSSTILCGTRNALLCLMLFLHDAGLDSSMAECQRHFQHQRRASDFPDSAISTSLSLHGVARRLAVPWATLWHSNLCICIRITPPVSDGCLLLSVCTGEST